VLRTGFGAARSCWTLARNKARIRAGGHVGNRMAIKDFVRQSLTYESDQFRNRATFRQHRDRPAGSVDGVAVGVEAQVTVHRGEDFCRVDRSL
jgi:hypothetical protein